MVTWLPEVEFGGCSKPLQARHCADTSGYFSLTLRNRSAIVIIFRRYIAPVSPAVRRPSLVVASPYNAAICPSREVDCDAPPSLFSGRRARRGHRLYVHRRRYAERRPECPADIDGRAALRPDLALRHTAGSAARAGQQQPIGHRPERADKPIGRHDDLGQYVYVASGEDG